MSTSAGTSGSAKAARAADRAALARAAKLLAQKPRMSRAAALRKAGVKSAPQIKRLGPLLGKKQESGRTTRGPAKATKVKSTQKRTAAKTSQLRSNPRDDARSWLPDASNLRSFQGWDRPQTGSGQDLIQLWTEQTVRWWTNLMRMTPVGFFFSAIVPNSKRER